MMETMTARVRIVGWVAAVIVGLAMIGLGVRFAAIGVSNADQWSSTLGIFVSVIGLAVSIYSAVLTRRSLPFHAATGTSQARAAHTGNVENAIKKGKFHGPVIQARDVTDVTAA